MTVPVVPVLDVLGGRAVRADGGPRARYEPLRSVLVAGAAAADPLELARAIRDVVGSRALYVAHLDAIAEARRTLRDGRSGQGRPGQGRPALATACELVGSIAALGVEVWVDAGTGYASAAGEVLAAGASRAVVGLETLAGLEELDRLGGDRRLTFGLDVRSGSVVAAAPELRRLSPGGAAARAAAAGFREILLLDLDRVGRGGGPPVEALRALRGAVPGVQWGVGGGVRDESDVAALGAAGAAWCLAGSAFHRGLLRPRSGQVRSAAPGPSVSLQTAD